MPNAQDVYALDGHTDPGMEPSNVSSEEQREQRRRAAEEAQRLGREFWARPGSSTEPPNRRLFLAG